jgi:hypothetical protein
MDKDNFFGMFGDDDWWKKGKSFNNFMSDTPPIDDDEFLDLANRNSYNLLTGKLTLEDCEAGIPMVHNPFKREPREIETIMQYFIETEEYEKCAILRDMLNSGEFLEETSGATASKPPRE